MPRDEAESSISAKPRDGKRRAAREQNPPPYGAQLRQDALWEGGNDAIPPEWEEFKMPDGRTVYQDDSLTMSSWKRPLPGVRLDYPDQVLSGCEWHVSPLGWSYFVNHNKQTTSWKKPTPERPAGSLTPECTIEGHFKSIWSLAFLGSDCNIFSTSSDDTIRQWKRDGKPVGKPLDGDGTGVGSIVISPDKTMVLSGSGGGILRLWNIRKGSMVGSPWEGHNAAVRCLDWSPNALEIASGSQDGTIRRWNPDTGRQIAPPIETNHSWVHTVRYSPQSDKFASGGDDNIICVWSMDNELLIEIKGHEATVRSLRWTKDGAHIFSSSSDTTIRKWQSVDGEELFVLQGHGRSVRSLCLMEDERHLISASIDCSVRIWDLDVKRQVGKPLLHDYKLFTLAMSPDEKYIVSAGADANIYVWSLEAALKHNDDEHSGDDGNVQPNANLEGHAAQRKDNPVARPVFEQQSSKRGLQAKYGEDFFGNGTDGASRRATLQVIPPSALDWRSLFGLLDLSPRPSNASHPIPPESRRGIFNFFSFFSGGNSGGTSEVAPARDEDRYGITPETDEEAAAAMERTSGDEANNSTQSGKPAAGTPASQRLPTQPQGPIGEVGEKGDDVNEGVSCCALIFGRRRSTSQKS
ncbi:WD40 repeat-like protein [Suillus weaverae]|nr:WD40 repeat-like protein [Suillus weaverae]